MSVEDQKKKNSKAVEKKPAVKKEEPVYDPVKDCQKNVLFLEKMIQANNKEKLPRVLRQTSQIRQHLTISQLKQLIHLHLSETTAQLFPQLVVQCEVMLTHEETVKTSQMDIVGEKKEDPIETPTASGVVVVSELPEVEVYFAILVLQYLTQLTRENGVTDAILSFVDSCVARVKQFNDRRTMDVFRSKIYHFFSLMHEQHQGGEKAAALIRPELLAAHRTACLHHDLNGQATLVNLLVRNYLSESLYEQASKFVSKCSFPEAVSNNQFVRFLYYVGKIKAIQLDYTDAHTKLNMAARKVPTNTAHGFRKAVAKLIIIVQLLMGEIPERQSFNQLEFKESLVPYLDLTNAVRIGNLEDFNGILQRYSALFKKDNTYTLILRLRHNVIKTGLRKISISYSKISFQDICSKLALDSPENTEFVCAKAIRDGVIDAVIDHKNGWMLSKETVDIYGTTEPQQAFQKRITFCLDVHNEAVKAMRYPPNAYKKDLESAEERQEREKQEEELAKEIEEEMDEEGL